MIWDIHVHIAQIGRQHSTGHSPSSRRIRLMLRRLGFTREILQQPDIDETIRGRLLSWIAQSSLDRVVLLALDAAHDEAGVQDAKRTSWVTSNDFVANLTEGHRELLFGASIHPYRKDALTELAQVAAQGACLLKWIPSAQRIRLDDPACIPFYEKLADLGLPLLVHTGNEHVSSFGRNRWNDPKLLTHALGRGVTVIAAHCGARMFLHERCRLKQFCRMALDHENLYGDIAAFGIPTRIRALRTLQRNEDLISKIIYGSDFPAYTMERWFSRAIGAKQAAEIRREANPLEKPYRLMRAMDLPEEVFTRAGTLLRLAPSIGEEQ